MYGPGRSKEMKSAGLKKEVAFLNVHTQHTTDKKERERCR